MSERQTEVPGDLTSQKGVVPFIFEQKESRKTVVAAIAQLPEMQKEVVLLRFYHDLKFREIAQVTGASESTVKSRLRQGLQKLRTFFKRGESEDEEAIRRK
jgi:RNA polymerase sigma-70 factor (ECF subfamily)